jgi:hypothetical protein
MGSKWFESKVCTKHRGSLKSVLQIRVEMANLLGLFLISLNG